MKYIVVREIARRSCAGCCFQAASTAEEHDCTTAEINCEGEVSDEWIVIEDTPEGIAKHAALMLGVNADG